MEADTPDDAAVIRELKADYESNWQVITELMNYSMGHIALEKVGLTPPEARLALESDEGKEVLRNWQSVFSRGISQLMGFNTYRESGGEVDMSGWLSMNQSSSMVIDSLRKVLLGRTK